MISSYGAAIINKVGRLFIQATTGNKLIKDPTGGNLVCSLSSCKRSVFSNILSDNTTQ